MTVDVQGKLVEIPHDQIAKARLVLSFKTGGKLEMNLELIGALKDLEKERGSLRMY